MRGKSGRAGERERTVGEVIRESVADRREENGGSGVCADGIYRWIQ